MPGPQLENGYTRLANELMEALAHTNLSPKQCRCMWFLLRRTYGWGKKTARITTKEWIEGTGLYKQHVYKALQELRERNMVTRNSDQYGINKHYTQWREVTRTGDHLRGHKNSLPFSHKNSLPNSEKVVTRSSDPTYKENILKEKRKGQVTRSSDQIPTGRVQPKSHQVPPCKLCTFQYAVGYDGMKDGVCLDCRQEEVKT